MTHGVFKGIPVLEVGHAFIGIGGDDAAKVGAGDERQIGFQLQLDLEDVGFIAPDACHRIAVVHQKHGYGAGARGNQVEALVRRYGAHGKNQVETTRVF